MDYTIVSISDRAFHNIEKNKNILSHCNYHNISFFDGNKNDAFEAIFNRNFTIFWDPADGRKTPPLSSEFGVWMSHILILEYIIKNKIKFMVVLEDDVEISKNFVDVVKNAISEVETFDFISLYYDDDKDHEPYEVDCQLELLERPYNQYAYIQGIVYSLSGAKKILKFFKNNPIKYTVDCCIFDLPRLGIVDAYRIKKDFEIVKHDTNIPSEIDSTNYRYIIN